MTDLEKLKNNIYIGYIDIFAHFNQSSLLDNVAMHLSNV